MEIIRYNSFGTVDFFGKNSFFNIDEFFESESLVSSKYNIVHKVDEDTIVIMNTLYDSVIILNSDEVELFNSAIHRDEKTYLDKELYKLGILVAKSKCEEIIVELQQKELLLNRNGIASITILPTQVCNARCEYCFAEHNAKITMSDETIKDVVNFFVKNFAKGDRVQIRWFGGEPLVAKDVIDSILTEIDIAFNKELLFESVIFTNGSLLDDSIIELFIDKWHMKKVQLTIDGYRKEHNRRKNYIKSDIDYYEKILKDIEKLLNFGINVDCRLNLDRDNIKEIDAILSDLLPYKDNKHFRARLTILRPSDCGYNRYNYIKPKDYKWAYELLYKKAFEYGFLEDINSILPIRRRENCISKSLNKVIIGADGKLYKCLQKVFDDKSSVGNLKEGIHEKKYIEDYCCKEIHKECKECIYLPTCVGGCDAYWELNEKTEITPCIREKYFYDLLSEFVYKWSQYGKII